MAVRFLAADPRFVSPRFTLAVEAFETPDGLVERPVIHHPGAVGIIACPDPDHLVLVRQYRYALRRWTLEIPAGTREPDEAPEVTAARELQEEAGYRASRLIEVTRFLPAPGVSDEVMILYRAEGLEPAPTDPDHGELIHPEVIALRDWRSLRDEGLICEAKTLIAVALLGESLVRA